MPPALVELLRDPKWSKVGVGVLDDSVKLEADFPGVAVLGRVDLSDAFLRARKQNATGRGQVMKLPEVAGASGSNAVGIKRLATALLPGVIHSRSCRLYEPASMICRD
eukprot:SAG31_NODE_5943_length_2247_cov_1.319367_1_plen_108_part_00